LCEAAKDGQILVTSRIAVAVSDAADITEIGQLSFKGLSRPLAVSNVAALKVAGRRDRARNFNTVAPPASPGNIARRRDTSRPGSRTTRRSLGSRRGRRDKSR